MMNILPTGIFRPKKCPKPMSLQSATGTAYNSASNAIPNCKAPKTPHYSLVQRAGRATRYTKLFRVQKSAAKKGI
jgi:hypothetical protein